MLRRTRILVAGAMAVTVVTACTTADSANEDASATSGITACKEPRPQICTAHYDPVCGLHENGDFKSHANACSACSVASVSGYRPGACE